MKRNGNQLRKFWPKDGLTKSITRYTFQGPSLNNVYSGIVFQALLKFVPEIDSKIFRQALTDFESTDFDELLDCLENLDCKWKPTKENIDRLVKDLAHQELIQKPMFVINCWTLVVKNIMTLDELNNQYAEHLNLSRNILKSLCFEEPLNSNEQNVASYLKKFIRESDEKILCNFLRFVTGSNMLIQGCSLKVSFAKEQNVNLRTPTSHTCSCQLVLPTTYDSLSDFKHEFTSVLSSSIWIMDIV